MSNQIIKYPAHHYNFFQLLQLLESKRSLPLIHSASGEAFPAADIAYDSHDKQIKVHALGLLSVDSPLPAYMRRQNHSDDSTAAWSDFINIFNRDLYQKFFLLWKKYHPIFGNEQSTCFRCLALFTPSLPSKRSLVFAFAKQFSSKRRSVVGLQQIFRQLLPEQRLIVQSSNLSWKCLDNITHLQAGHLVLGSNVLLGRRFLDAAGSIVLNVYFKSRKAIRAFLNDSLLLENLRLLLRAYLGPLLNYQLKLFVPIQQAKPLRLAGRKVALSDFATLGAARPDYYCYQLA